MAYIFNIFEDKGMPLENLFTMQKFILEYSMNSVLMAKN